jgi:hypothetical protein
MNPKGTVELSDLLMEFETLVCHSIRAELKRIGRPVLISEKACKLFNTDFAKYLESIRLELDHQIVIETSFCCANEKYLTLFVSADVIGHRKMIGLLPILQGIGR